MGQVKAWSFKCLLLDRQETCAHCVKMFKSLHTHTHTRTHVSQVNPVYVSSTDYSLIWISTPDQECLATAHFVGVSRGSMWPLEKSWKLVH